MHEVPHILIFGGTTEGRLLCGFLRSHQIPFIVSVATDYGEELTKNDDKTCTLIKGRLDENEMMELLAREQFGLVIDATHPYAGIVTQNIKKACGASAVPYMRVIRQPSAFENTRCFQTVQDATAYLNMTEGNILLTTGSKDLEAFAKIEDFKERLYVRILPMIDGLSKCIALGIQNSHIFCMQGNFSKEINMEMIKMIDAKIIVTKDSGDVGGFENKVLAAKEMGIETIVIARPDVEQGLSLEEMINALEEMFALKQQINHPRAVKRFPLFIDIHHAKVVVVGGGHIAARRIKTLSAFTENITVISPEITEQLQSLVQWQKIKWVRKCYEKSDIAGAMLVIAATDHRQTNQAVGVDAKQMDQWVSVCDRKEECSFWFPGIVCGDDLVVGLVSSDGNHKGLKKNIDKIQEVLRNEF